MKYFGDGLSDKHKKLKKIIYKQECFDEARDIFLDIHAHLHLSEVAQIQEHEVDRLIYDLSNNDYAIMPTKQDETIAWIIWHIARIEDLTMGILVAQGEQVFNADWQQRLHINRNDTGNAMSDDEIMDFSHHVEISELLQYRNAVGQKTREIINHLKPTDMRRKIAQFDLDKILAVGGVTKQDDSLWLLEFWGQKDVAGILLMPPTRHVMLHLNDCGRMKEMIRTRQKFYRC